MCSLLDIVVSFSFVGVSQFRPPTAAELIKNVKWAERIELVPRPGDRFSEEARLQPRRLGRSLERPWWLSGGPSAFPAPSGPRTASRARIRARVASASRRGRRKRRAPPARGRVYRPSRG